MSPLNPHRANFGAPSLTRALSAGPALAARLIVRAGLVGALLAALPANATDDVAVPPKFEVGPIPQSILDVKTDNDFIYDTVKTIAPEIGGYDDVFLNEDETVAYTTGRDGWIWKVDLKTEKAERFVDVPVMAAGLHHIPGEATKIITTNSRRGGQQYPEGEEVGLYTLDLATKEVTALVTRVPHYDDPTEPTVIPIDQQERVRVDSLDDSNSRPLAITNDAAVSADGKRVYFTESYVTDGATMGGPGSIATVVMLGNSGRLWMYDFEDQTVGLVGAGYAFTDGILMEADADGDGIEDSVLMTDNVRFQLHRLHLSGDRAGESEVLWKDLPGLGDGMRRDSKGRIWVTFIAERSPQLDYAHMNPEVKPFLMKHPQLISMAPTNSILLLSPDASTPLWFTSHYQTRVTSIAAVTPGKAGLYLSNFSESTPGLHRIDIPLE
jgi:sugar lactone lactonase YvrE